MKRGQTKSVGRVIRLILLSMRIVIKGFVNVILVISLLWKKTFVIIAHLLKLGTILLRHVKMNMNTPLIAILLVSLVQEMI